MSRPDGIPPQLFLFYCLSGFASLGYQVVWFRIYAERFGSTNLTFLVVLCSFIAGLGFGALASRAVTGCLGRRFRTGQGLRCYGLVELAVSLGVCLTLVAGLVPSGLWGSFPYESSAGIFEPTLGYQLGRLITATVCVFTPALLMGVTFPLLCHVFARDKRFPSALYAWNTLGACLGVLACHFVFLPELGHTRTLGVLIGLNLLIGGYFLFADPGQPTTDGEKDDGPDPSPRPGDTQKTSTGLLITLGALGGLLTGGLEGDLFKRMWSLGASSGSAMVFISFWAILAIFLASTVITRFPRIRLPHIKLCLILAFVVYAASSHYAYRIREVFFAGFRTPLQEQLPRELLARELPVAVLTDPLFALLFVGLFAFPVIFLVALLLPYVCNAAQDDKRSLDRAYGANTLAFCLGMVTFTWLAPRISIFYSLKLILLVLLIGVTLGWFLPAKGRLPVWRLGLAGLALAAAAVPTPAGFDRGLLDPQMQVYHYPVRALKSNGAHTTYVVANPLGDTLYFDSHPMSGTNHASQTYMRLMAHVPLLAHPDPQTALLVGFGAATTSIFLAGGASSSTSTPILALPATISCSHCMAMWLRISTASGTVSTWSCMRAISQQAERRRSGTGSIGSAYLSTR